MSDWYALKARVSDSGDKDQDIQACWNDAVTLLTLATESAFRPIPAEVMNRMTLEVGQTLFDRKNSPSGTSQFATYDGGNVPVMAPRDPLARVRPILAMYVVPF